MYGENQRLITNLEDWKVEYRKDKTQVWVILTLSDDSQYFFNNSTRKDFEYWHKIIQIARKGDFFVKEVGLRYRSNVYRQPVKADGLYLSKSATGSPGGETVETMTIGIINDQIVSKTVIQLPSLTIMTTGQDSLQECFTEATWIWKKKTS